MRRGSRCGHYIASPRPYFRLLGILIASTGPREAPSRSSASATRRVTSGRTDGGLASGRCRKCRRCLQDEGTSEGKESSSEAHERKGAAAASLRLGLTTLLSQLVAQPAHGLIKVDHSKIAVNLGPLGTQPASTGLDSRSTTRDSHCKPNVDKMCPGGVDLMPVHQGARRPTSKAQGVK